jgi:predicted nucleotidyltransferase
MEDATAHLRALARRIVDVTLAHVPLRAALLAGSAGRGDADFYSDIDLLLYVDEIPRGTVLDEILAEIGATDAFPFGEADEHERAVDFDLGGVRAQVAFSTVERFESHLDRLLDRLEELDSPLQKLPIGLLEGMPLHGDALLERWRARVRDYPEPLRRAMVKTHWRFFPLAYYGEAIATRDAELFRIEMLVNAAFNLLGVLAGLNRLYFARFQLKRTRRLVAGMRLAPDDLADRLEALFRLEPAAAAEELERLVEETRSLVLTELPDLELSTRYRGDARHRPWQA